jgi:hypothetical protein
LKRELDQTNVSIKAANDAMIELRADYSKRIDQHYFVTDKGLNVITAKSKN